MSKKRLSLILILIQCCAYGMKDLEKRARIEHVPYNPDTQYISMRRCSDAYKTLVCDKTTKRAVKQFEYTVLSPQKTFLCLVIKQERGQWQEVPLEDRFKHEIPEGSTKHWVRH